MIVFRFDYNSSPILLSGKYGRFVNCFVSGNGYFIGDMENMNLKVPEPRLKGEYELEQKVKLVYDIYCRIWDVDRILEGGSPYLGFSSDREREIFFDACDHVIKRMSELFGDEFTVWENDERTVRERRLNS